MGKKKFNIYDFVVLFLMISVILLAGAVLLSFVFIGINKINIISNKYCLEEIAKNYCNEEGLVYDDFYSEYEDLIFECKESERSYDIVKFRFTKEEIEWCYG